MSEKFIPVPLAIEDELEEHPLNLDEAKKQGDFPMKKPEGTHPKAFILCANGPHCNKSIPGIRRMLKNKFNATVSSEDVWLATARANSCLGYGTPLGYLPDPIQISHNGKTVNIAVGFTGFCSGYCVTDTAYGDRRRTPLAGFGQLVRGKHIPTLAGDFYDAKDMIAAIEMIYFSEEEE